MFEHKIIEWWDRQNAWIKCLVFGLGLILWTVFCLVLVLWEKGRL